MDNPFFTAFEDMAIERDRFTVQCENKRANNTRFTAKSFAEQTNNALMPFRHYLSNSIDALKNKEVSCEWLPLANNRYCLKPDLRIWHFTIVCELEILNSQKDWYEIVSESNGTLLDSFFSPELSDPVIVGKGADRQCFTLEQNHFHDDLNKLEIFLPGMPLHEEIQWSGYQLKIRPLSVLLDNLTLVNIDGVDCNVISQDDNRLTVEGRVNANSALSINGQDTKFRSIHLFDESSLMDFEPLLDGNGWLLFSKEKPNLLLNHLISHNEKPHKISDVTAQRLSQLSLTHLNCNGVSLNVNAWSLSVESDEIILEERQCAEQGCVTFTQKDQITCLRFPQISFLIELRKVDEKWIQLIEKDSGANDSGKSDLDYFFDDNQHIKILDSRARKGDEGFRVLKSRPEEKQLLLAKNTRGKRNWNSEYPPQDSKKREIRVSVDTNQLQRQKNAINQLMNRPAGGHWPLIQLLQTREKSHWPNTEPVPEATIHWHVLTDLTFDGCDRQREFVSKALANQDFTILDGPPGTGKTTTILELILQLVLQGKRVLLSASTHAAINNVLERVKENETLMSHIFPLRIGDESNAIGVEAFQFDNLLEALKKSQGCEGLSKQLMVDASNLVCGTTLGILRLFNDKEIFLDAGEPPFDVMIIDECSKTTFQEFLVPARFAKRWVLVGDVRQLSPFTDREQIVANLDNLMLVPPRGKTPAQTLSTAIQRACFLLEVLRGDKQAMLVPVSVSVLLALQQELAARLNHKELHHGLDNILIITHPVRRDVAFSAVKNITTLFVEDIKQAPWTLYGVTLCFVDETILDELQPLIPIDMLILHSNWHLTSHAFEHHQAGMKTQAFKIKTTAYTNTSDIQKELLETLNNSKWSEEVCWRLEREYWLRLSKNYHKKTRYLSETLERLYPKSVSADGRIHVLKNIAFPSILEALSGDGFEKRKKDDPTTLNKGFNLQEKKQRHTSLNYQHRMHPDISAFPRKQFYPEGMLVDGCQTRIDRTWEYKRYLEHKIWLDVRGHNHHNNNLKEVQAIITELKAFCIWAEGKTKKKGEPYDVAILTFYKGQEKALREALQKDLPANKGCYARFNFKGIFIKLATVDYFQGQEADVVFLSMVNTQRDGFMDSPNRLNVSITRARYQLVIVGHHEYFSQRSHTDELKNLAKGCLLHFSPSPVSS